VSRVVDASVALKWVVHEEGSEAADRLLDEPEDLLAPDFLLIEAANVLWKRTVRSEMTPAEADQAFGLLRDGVMVFLPTTPLLESARRLARRLRHPVYDCLYIALAERERAPLVTADSRLVRRLGSRSPVPVRVLR
jgi:predicted nucleic acid-binding protein